jgi:sugar phosphate isomerase/epimerase
VQLCDAPRTAPDGGPEALADEARHRRLLPGAGELDLAALIAAVPPYLPFSVEVQSDQLFAEFTVRQRAVAAFRAATAAVSAR